MREDLDFDSQGTRCAAWLYRPETAGNRPCVVMAHGFSGVREQRLDAFAERFAAAGLAVLLFDYRHFGASDGQPRQLLSIRRQLQDWQAAVSTARSLDGVDRDRVALYGMSLSGGHVQHIAANDEAVAAVIAQVPFCDGLRNLGVFGARHILRLTFAGLRDSATTLVTGNPYRIPAVGQPGALAVLNTPGTLEGFARMDPPGSTWRNEVCARIALMLGLYRPGRLAGRIRCPILYCLGESDNLTPPSLAHAAAEKARHSEVNVYPSDHFDMAMPPLWERVIADQSDFLVRHLIARDDSESQIVTGTDPGTYP